MTLRWTLLWVLVAATACTQAPQPAQLARDAEIRGIREDRIDKYRQSVGIVVGLIEPQGRRVIAYGKLDQADGRPLNGDTVFEIASITKLFTSLALAKMVQHGDVKLTDPVARYLSGIKVPERGGHQITLEDLATHTSGLPREPFSLKPRSVSDPWAGYSFEDLSEYFSSYQLSRDPGSRFEYSNLGAALLGTPLARRADVDYEALIRKLITGPLDMASTGVTPTQDMASRLSAGHNYLLEAVTSTKPNIFAPAGALRSTVNDLLKLLSAVLGYTQTPLAPAIRATVAVHRPMAPLMARLVAVVAGGTGGDQIHLGWSSNDEAARDPYYPQSRLTFFSRSADSQVTFKVDRQGRAFELMFHFGDGRTKLYTRIQ